MDLTLSKALEHERRRCERLRQVVRRTAWKARAARGELWELDSGPAMVGAIRELIKAALSDDYYRKTRWYYCVDEIPEAEHELLFRDERTTLIVSPRPFTAGELRGDAELIVTTLCGPSATLGDVLVLRQEREEVELVIGSGLALPSLRRERRLYAKKKVLQVMPSVDDIVVRALACYELTSVLRKLGVRA